MNTLLLFFALPIAVIIISIALQRILRSPILVSLVIFAIFLVVTFIIGDLNFLVATIIYTIISFITAIIVSIIYRILREFNDNNGCRMCRNFTENSNNNTSDSNQVLSLSSNENDNNENSNGNNNGISARINVIPNNNNSGNICGNYRRR